MSRVPSITNPGGSGVSFRVPSPRGAGPSPAATALEGVAQFSGQLAGEFAEAGQRMKRADQANRLAQIQTDAIQTINQAKQVAAEAGPGEQLQAFDEAVKPLAQGVEQIEDPETQRRARSYIERRIATSRPEISQLQARRISEQAGNETQAFADTLIGRAVTPGFAPFQDPEAEREQAFADFRQHLQSRVGAGTLREEQTPEIERSFRKQYFARELNTLVQEDPDEAEALLESPEARTSLTDAEVRSFRNTVSAARSHLEDRAVDRLEIAAIQGDAEAFQQLRDALPEGLDTDKRKRVVRAEQLMDRARRQDAALDQAVGWALSGQSQRLWNLEPAERETVLRRADDAVRQNVALTNPHLNDEQLRWKQEIARLQMRKENNAFPAGLQRKIDGGANLTRLELIDARGEDFIAQARERMGENAVAAFETYRQLESKFGHWLTSNVDSDARSLYEFAEQALRYGRASDSRGALATAAMARKRARDSGESPFAKMEKDRFNAAFDDLHGEIGDVSWWPDPDIRNAGHVRDRLFSQASFIQELTGAGAEEALRETVRRMNNDFVVVNDYAIDLSNQSLPPALGEDQSDAARRQTLEDVTRFVAERYVRRFGGEDGVTVDDLTLRPDPAMDGAWTLMDERLAGGKPVDRAGENPMAGEAPEPSLPLAVMSNNELARWIDRMERSRRREAIEGAGGEMGPGEREAAEASRRAGQGFGRAFAEAIAPPPSLGLIRLNDRANEITRDIGEGVLNFLAEPFEAEAETNEQRMRRLGELRGIRLDPTGGAPSAAESGAFIGGFLNPNR